MTTLKEFIRDNPHYFGIFFALVGLAGLLAAIYDWGWLFKADVNPNTYSWSKIDGWINFFGRKTARIVVGGGSVVVIMAGAFWFWAYAFYYR